MPTDVTDFNQLLVEFFVRLKVDTLSAEDLENVRGWFNKLVLTDETACIAYGIMLECLRTKHHRVALALLPFLKETSKRLNKDHIIEPINLMTSVLNDAYAVRGKINGGYYFLGEPIVNNSLVARVTTSTGFITMMSPAIPPRLSSRSIRSQAIRGMLDPFIRKLSSRTPFWFIARGDDCNKLLKDFPSDQQGTALRNHLGLYHLRNYKDALVVIMYTVNGPQIFSPTVFDAQGYAVFQPSFKPGWGIAVNLSDLGDGVAEGIHESQILGDSATCKTWVDVEVETRTFDWTSFRGYYLDAIQKMLRP